MKKIIRLLSLILCLALMISMVGCAGKTAAPTEPTTVTTEPTTVPTEPPEPPAEEVYAQARANLEALTDVTLDLIVTTYTTVAADVFSQQSNQCLTYQAIGSEEAVIDLEEAITLNVHSPVEETEDAEENEPLVYHEVWSQGTVYLEIDDAYHFCSAVSKEDAAARYIPVVLLDATLYSSIVSEVTGSGRQITFSEATAPENWAIPEEGELIEASGTALVSQKGILEEMTYSLTYKYGPSQIELNVTSRPLAEANTVAAPDNPDIYTSISYVDALRDIVIAPAMLMQADSITASDLKSTYTQAAGVLYNISTTIHIHGRREETLANVTTDVFFMDYGSNTKENLKQEETFRNGKVTTVVNDGLPTMNTGISWEEMREYAASLLLGNIMAMENWQEVTATDLGSLLFLEFTYNENFGNTHQNEVCSMLWGDPSFLYNLASEYKNVELNGYLSIDKYTGLPVASGYYYEGLHTIDGYDYPLTVQYDQSIEAPALGAYKEITEELLPEPEPETKPTPLFYHVTGENGQEMWLLGTIHVGDARTAYLPDEIYNAFAASDALALECDSDAFDQQLEEDDALAEKVSNLYLFSNKGETFESLMEEEAYAQAVRLLKAVGGYNMNMPYLKPYTWSDTIDMFYMRQGYQLHRDQGIERRLTAWAQELDKKIIEVESSLFQIEMLTGFSTELQLQLLEDTMEGTAREYFEGVAELFDLWCAGDEATMREELSSEVDTAELTEEELEEYNATKHLYDEYTKAMELDRNDGMLKKAIEYLESGDVIFYAVGLAHLLNDTNGLVDTLREAGYTVELVSYGE